MNKNSTQIDKKPAKVMKWKFNNEVKNEKSVFWKRALQKRPVSGSRLKSKNLIINWKMHIERTTRTLKLPCKNAIENEEKRDRKRIDVKADTLLSIEPLPLNIKQNACTVVERPYSSCYFACSVRTTAQDGLFTCFSSSGSSTFCFYHFNPRTRKVNTCTYSFIAFLIRKQEISTVGKDRMITDTVNISFRDCNYSVYSTFNVVVFGF